MKTKIKENNKKGISLIVLVITIIVMIILAAAVILSLSSNGIIDRANEAVDKTDKAQVQNLASLLWADAYLDKNKSSGNLRAEVVKGLKNSGITEQDYVVFASESGVDVVPTDSWDHIYTYSEAMGWSTKITKEDEIEDKNPTIIAKFYKMDRLIKPADVVYGKTYSFNPGNEYKMFIEGTGEMPNLMEHNLEINKITGGYAWQLETVMMLGEYTDYCTIPYVTEAVVSNGITKIGGYTFVAASSLKDVSIGKNVTEIKRDAFYLCDNIENINILISNEEWNSLITREENHGLFDAKVNYKCRTKIERLINEGWQEAYDSGKKTQNALETAVSEYLEANEISSEELALYNIDVTTKGVNITSKTVTLSDTISSALDYGKTVNYSANGINDWKVLYKQTVGTEEYVYLIASEKVDGNKLPTNIPGAIIEGDNIFWNAAPSVVASGTINSTRWLANWSDYSTNPNGRYISYFLDENYWTAFKNTSKYKDYVVGAIGTPTLEMFAASYNKRSEALGDTSIIELTDGEYGYMIGENYHFRFSRIDSLYCWNAKKGTSIWLASPSGFGADDWFSVYDVAGVYYGSLNSTSYGLRPVVCLKSSIQACVGLSGDNADIILK